MLALQWAEGLFGRADLGDKRRRARLIKFASVQVEQRGVSTLASTQGDSGQAEGFYRWIGNRHFETNMVATAGYEATARALPTQGDIVVVQDMTTLTYPACLSPELGPVGSSSSSRTQGVHVQSALAVDYETGQTLGLVEQHGWVRPTNERLGDTKKLRDYDDKESSKWQRTDEVLRERLAARLAQVITVGDRETDIGLYLAYKVVEGERFVLRALHNRKVDGPDGRLRAAVERAPVMGTPKLDVPQRGGRQARTAKLEIRACPVRLMSEDLPDRQGLKVNAVWVHEQDPPPGVTPLDWVLYTTEPIDSQAAVEKVLRCYRLRWRIEDFHKVWKSGGCDVEGLRNRSAEALIRVAVVRSFAAVRILQLRDSREDEESPCNNILTDLEWRLLWVATEKDKKLPKRPPSKAWACRALGRLGRWMPRKDAYPGLEAMWMGWDRLEAQMEGIRLAEKLKKKL